MARKSAFLLVQGAPSPDDTTPDAAVAWLNDWLAVQSKLFDAGLAQMTSSQAAVLASCLEIQQQLLRQWQTQADGAMWQGWWQQWASAWQRGSAQPR